MLSLLVPILSAGGAGVPTICALAGDAEIVLASPEITGRDILAAGACAISGESEAAAPIAVLPAGQQQYTLTCGQLAGLAARRRSGVEVKCVAGTERIRFALRAAPPAPAGGDAIGGRPDLSEEDTRGSGHPSYAPVGEKGDRVYGTVASGPVRIEREFELLQPAWPGRGVFARSQAGEVVVLSVPEVPVAGGPR